MRSMQRTFTLLLMAVLLLAGAATAQGPSQIIQVEIPFEFEAGGHVLPAGEYFITRFQPEILVLSDSRRHVVAAMVTMSVQALAPVGEPKLQFNVDGGRNVLARIWDANSRYGHELSPAKRRPVFAKSPSDVRAAAAR